MVAGTALGQAASIVLSPVLTRLYTPEQFGYLSVYTAALTILGVVASLGFELAIPIAATELEMANLLALSLGTVASLTIGVALAAELLPQQAFDVLWLGALASHRYLLPVGFLCLGGYYVAVAAATRLGAFRDIAATRVSQGVTGPVSQILLALLGAGTPGLAIGYVLGQSSGTLLLISRVKRLAPAVTTAVSWHGVCAAARRFARFPLFASWSRLFEMAGGGTILFVLISSCYSSEIAGYMFLIERVIARPLLIISTSLLQVITGEAGLDVKNDPARLRRRFWQVIPKQFVLAAGWIGLANLVAGWAFPLVFGEQWDPAIPCLHALSIGYLALMVLHPASTLLQIMERQVLAAAWQATRLALIVASVIVPWRLGLPAIATLWLASAAQLVACSTMLVLIVISIERIQPRRR